MHTKLCLWVNLAVSDTYMSHMTQELRAAGTRFAIKPLE